MSVVLQVYEMILEKKARDIFDKQSEGWLQKGKQYPKNKYLQRNMYYMIKNLSECHSHKEAFHNNPKMLKGIKNKLRTNIKAICKTTRSYIRKGNLKMQKNYLKKKF